MTVQYQELTGSPKVSFDRRGGAAIRRFLIAWADIAAFNAELFPRPSSGYANLAAIPGAPWLIAQRAEYEPFSEGGEAAPDDAPTATINSYTDAGCLAVVNYAVPEDDQQQGSPGGGGGNPDGTGPGGDEGSSAGEPVEWIRHEITIGGEFLTLPTHGLEWANAGVEGLFGREVSADLNAGLILPTIEHQITLMHVRRPPWAAIRATLGKANSDKYAGASPKRVLFLGGEFRWGRGDTGFGEWEMTYKFSEKDRDWNHFFRVERGQFEELRRKDGQPIYESKPFAALFKNLYA